MDLDFISLDAPFEFTIELNYLLNLGQSLGLPLKGLVKENILLLIFISTNYLIIYYKLNFILIKYKNCDL